MSQATGRRPSREIYRVQRREVRQSKSIQWWHGVTALLLAAGAIGLVKIGSIGEIVLGAVAVIGLVILGVWSARRHQTR